MTDSQRAVMQQALEALKALLPPQSDTNHDGYDARDVRKWRNTLDALRAALAEPAQHADPTDPGHDVDVLREHVRHLERRVRELVPPQRKPLTEVDILRKWLDATLPERSMGKPPLSKTLLAFVRDIEREHGIE